MKLATKDIKYDAGINNNNATKVPTTLLPTIAITQALKSSSLHLPSTTSSVMIDKCGSIKIDVSIVAVPLITGDKDKQVILRFGDILAAYIGAKAPAVIMATEIKL